MHDTESQHRVDYLFDQLRGFGPYPTDKVQPTDQRIEGLAFFPGGAGLRNAHPRFRLPQMPIGEVMVLGHIFNTVALYHKAVHDNSENENSPTWRPLLCFLDTCHIAATSCFFTNGYMGLKVESAGSFGAFFQALLRDNKDYIKSCRGFLLKQLQVQQPRLLLVLGKDVWPILRPLAPDDLASWLPSHSFRDLDECNESLVEVQFEGLTYHTVVVALTQPTQPYHTTNVEQRVYDNQAGEAAEKEMVREALKRSRLQPGADANA